MSCEAWLPWHHLLIPLFQLHLQVLAIHWEAMHSRNGGLRSLWGAERDEAETPGAAFVVLLNPAAYDVPKVFKVLPHNLIIPAVWDVVDEQVCANWTSRALNPWRCPHIWLGRLRWRHWRRDRYGSLRVAWWHWRGWQMAHSLRPTELSREATRRSHRCCGREVHIWLRPRGLPRDRVIVVELALLRPGLFPRSVLENVLTPSHWAVQPFSQRCV